MKTISQNSEKKQIVKKTGEMWAKEFTIEMISPDGWFSEKEFKEELITKWEFLNRCSQSVVTPPDRKNRRAAQEFRNKLYNLNDKNP